MTVELDNFNTPQKKEYVVATVTIGLILSNVSFALRVWARLVTIKTLRGEDWFMFSGLLLSYATAVCLLYGLSTGLAEPFQDLTPDRRRGFLLSIWIIQKFQPPTLFCVKASILIFNAYIFKTRVFLRVSWAVGIATLAWSIGSFFGTVFQCSPPSFFWDKSNPDGKCASNTLLTIGLTSGVISCIGDIVILLMPLPLLVKLRVDKRTRMGLIGVFTLGIFVVVTSFIRWIALLGAPRDGFNSNQVQVGVWTYLEMSIGITCGNLPFLAPLLGCIGPRGSKSSAHYLRRRNGGGGVGNNPQQDNRYPSQDQSNPRRPGPAGMGIQPSAPVQNRPSPFGTGFSRLYDTTSVSEAEEQTDGSERRLVGLGEEIGLGNTSSGTGAVGREDNSTQPASDGYGLPTIPDSVLMMSEITVTSHRDNTRDIELGSSWLAKSPPTYQ